MAELLLPGPVEQLQPFVQLDTAVNGLTAVSATNRAKTRACGRASGDTGAPPRNRHSHPATPTSTAAPTQWMPVSYRRNSTAIDVPIATATVA